MASKRRIRRKECDGKKQHVSEEEAKGAVRHLYSKDRFELHIGRMNVYKCKFCPFWHVGHRPRNKRTRREHFL